MVKAEKKQAFLTLIEDNASQLEYDTELMQSVFRRMIHDGLTGLFLDTTLGGLGFDRKAQIDWIIDIASRSYALNFLLLQHEGALHIMSHCPCEEKREAIFQMIANENPGFGVSISHLRNTVNPSISAVQSDGGYIINGKINWMTGFGVFEKLLLGVATNTQREIHVLLDFKQSSQMNISKPMAVISASSVNNVSLEIDHIFVDEKEIIRDAPLGSFSNKTKSSIVHPATTLGLIKACFVLLDKQLLGRPQKYSESVLKKCETEYETLKKMLYEKVDNTIMIRTSAIHLLMNVITYLSACRGGRNVSLHDDLQRLWVNALQCLSVATCNEYTESMAASFIENSE